MKAQNNEPTKRQINSVLHLIKRDRLQNTFNDQTENCLVPLFMRGQELNLNLTLN